MSPTERIAATARAPETGFALLVFAAAFIAVFFVRAALIARFGTSLPFWDQWDAEAWSTIRPFALGQFGWTDLVAAHNEHRIATTRLAAIAMYELNGAHLDNNVGALLSSSLVAAAVAAVAAYAAPRLTLRDNLPFWIVLAAAALIPYNWENTLYSMQGAFALLITITLAGTYLAATREPGTGLSIALAALVALAVLTLGSGALTAIPIGAAVVLRAWRERTAWQRLVVPLALLALVLAAGLAVLPPAPQHASLHAQNAGEFIRAVGIVLSWPFYPTPYIAPFVWLPFALGTWRALRVRDFSAPTIVALAIGGWTLLQAAGVGYSRGHELVALASRYSDMFACGLVANAYFCAYLAPRDAAWRALRIAAGIAYALALTAGFWAWYQHAYAHLDGSAANHRAREALVARALAGPLDATLASANPNMLPYGNVPRLRMMLDDPTIRSSLVLPTGPLDANGRTIAWSTAPLSSAAAFVTRNAATLGGAGALLLAAIVVVRRTRSRAGNAAPENAA